MIVLKKGNILESNAEAFVNTVNTVGVMGKGIALQFKNAFPHNFEKYQYACKKRKLEIGQLLIITDFNFLYGEKCVINFPTKIHWRNPSRYEYIETGLITLTAYLQESTYQSVAIPALGCGNGGLKWVIVKQMITAHLQSCKCLIEVYEPAF
jgi:O-acetyl-ADP-ribose deacetylase (regulator of RNase III)